MHIKIRPHNETSRQRYEQHGHYHAGDAGLDLFIMEDQIIKAGDTIIAVGENKSLEKLDKILNPA